MPASPLLIVDAANVVGSVPDGWWRDRAGAARRLRDALAEVAETGLESATGSGLSLVPPLVPPLEVVLVVEGAAKGVPGSATVRVVAAPRSGDDTIVDLVRAAMAKSGAVPAEPGEAGSGDAGSGELGSGESRVVAVATSDRGLRERVTALGARVLGPRSLPYPRPTVG